MRVAIHAVTPAYVRELRGAGVAGTERIRDVAELRIHRVTAAYVRELAALGDPDLGRAELLQMAIHGVDAAEVREMRALGFGGLSAAVLATGFPDDPVPPGHADIRELGRELLGNSMLVFESAGVTLLATMVGSVVLSSRGGRFGDADEGSVPPGLQPEGKPAGEPEEEEEGGDHHH